ncbi:hypothetical protein Tco_1508804 [Tanacetum coccineum]
MSSYNQRECVGCRQPCDGFYSYLCTCQQCGANLINRICLKCTYGDGKPVTCCGCEGPLNRGFCSFCSSRAGNSFAYDPNPNSFDDSQNLSDYPLQPQSQTYSCELCGNDAYCGYDCPPQVPFELLPDEIKRIQQILERTLFDAITPDFPITDSLSMGDEHLSTIPEIESDELIKSSVENLVSTPSESEDLSNIESECDVPVCDDFTTVYNPLFDADNDFSSSDDKSFSDEDVPKEIYSNPLFDEAIISTKIDPHHFNAESDLIESLLNRDTLIISSPKFDSLLEEFSGELAHIDLIPSGINEADFDPEEEICLVERLLYDNSSPRPPEEFNSENFDAIIKHFSPSPIPVEDSDSLMEEIDLFLTPDDSMPPGIENDDYDSKGDILFLEELLSNDSPSLHENESFHFDVPSSPRPPAKPPDDGIYFEPEGTFLSWMFRFSISILLDQLKYGGSSQDQDSVNKNKRFIAPDYEASRARGFVIRSLELQHPQLHYGNPISNLID